MNADIWGRVHDWLEVLMIILAVFPGIPYRRGYLLYGPPGCGKSSFM